LGLSIIGAESRVRIQDKKIWVNETSIPLMGGEVHYWRLAPENWRVVLTRVKELGENVDVVYNIATYICWEFHETAPGCFDFEGKTDPRRNLKAFGPAHRDGLLIIIRPKSIFTRGGTMPVPEYAARFHRILVSGARSKYLEAVIPAIGLISPLVAGSSSARLIIGWTAGPTLTHRKRLGLGKRIGVIPDLPG
jgi:beta-galactosidase GanA